MVVLGIAQSEEADGYRSLSKARVLELHESGYRTIGDEVMSQLLV